MEMNSSSIRQLRCQMGWSQSDLAHHLGMPCSVVQSWELGQSTPNENLLSTLERLLQQAELSSLEMSEAPQMDSILEHSDQASVCRDDLEASLKR